ncbi:unnamed protein product [Camellia sinensis]
MDSMPVVFDISSDEECWGERRGGGEDGGVVGGGGDDVSWISELLEKFDREEDNSDDVVVVGEVVLNPRTRSKSSDDDCVVLDGNPDKPDVIENNVDDDSDDLQIVGQKGQWLSSGISAASFASYSKIACRDYPHPRHLCAKFPFTSTPHERQCHQCHCYVCDSLAPCVYWGNGTSSNDHCHATDKVESWKLLRCIFKDGEKAPLPMGLPQTTQVPPLALMQPDSLAQNQDFSPTTIPSCSTSADFGIPNQQSLYGLSRSKFHSHLVSQKLPSTRNNIIRRDRRHNLGNLGPQVINSHANFKRTGSGSGSAGDALTTNRSGYHLSNNNHVAQNSRNPSPMAASYDENPTRWQDFPNRMTSDSNVYQAPSLQNTGRVLMNSVPSQPQVSSPPNIGSSFVNSVSSLQATSQPNMGSNFVNSVPPQQPVSPQPNMGSNFVNSVPQPLVSPQPNMGSNFVNSVPQLLLSPQPNMGSNFINSVPQPLVSPQPNMGCSFVHPVPSQAQVYSQVGFQQGNGAQIALDSTFSDVNTSWVGSTGQSNQLSLADNSEIQSVRPTYHPPLVTEFDPQIPISTNPSSPDFQFENWVLENQPVSGDLENSVPSGLNVYSPEHIPLDAGGRWFVGDTILVSGISLTRMDMTDDGDRESICRCLRSTQNSVCFFSRSSPNQYQNKR